MAVSELNPNVLATSSSTLFWPFQTPNFLMYLNSPIQLEIGTRYWMFIAFEAFDPVEIKINLQEQGGGLLLGDDPTLTDYKLVFKSPCTHFPLLILLGLRPIVLLPAHVLLNQL